jgi:hypothetical protein
MKLSSYHNLLAVGGCGNRVSVFNYEYANLVSELLFTAEVMNVDWASSTNMMLVYTGEVVIVAFTRHEGVLIFSQLRTISLALKPTKWQLKSLYYDRRY